MTRAQRRAALAKKLGVSAEGKSLRELEAMAEAKPASRKQKATGRKKAPATRKVQPKKGGHGTYGGYERSEVAEIMASYPITGAEVRATGKGLVPKGAKRAIPSTSWKLRNRVFNEPVVLEFGVLAPHGTSLAAEKAGWDRPTGKRPAAGKIDWFVKRVPFEGNVAQLHKEIRKALKESGDFHHMAFEMLDRRGTYKGRPVYEVLLAS